MQAQTESLTLRHLPALQQRLLQSLIIINVIIITVILILQANQQTI